MLSALQTLIHKGRLALLPREARSVLRDRLTYLSPKKLARLTTAMREITQRAVPGDILEFGVALGGSSVLLAKHATPTRQFHGFDVFGLIPPPTSDKDDPKSKERFKAISAGKSRGIGSDIYYGYRTDLFESVCATLARVRFCLNAVLPRLAPDGIVMLDDYHDYGGCRTATDEFLSEHRGLFAVDDGANLVLRRAFH